MRKKVVWLLYDADTAIGINNEGELVFSYNLEDTDHTQGGENIYNGQDSVFWNNIRDAFPNELAEMYQLMRSTGGLSYESVEQMFEEHQSKFPEALQNEDEWFKYIIPFVENGEDYLGMLQGTKAEQRKWWLYNRFRYIDSKYVAGDALVDTITLRPYAAANISLTPYADIYATVKWDNTITKQRTARNATSTLICPYQTMNDNVVTIYSASQLASVGDLSGLKVGVCNVANAVRLQSLKIGDSDPTYDNPNLRSLTLGNNVLLQSVDVRNCSGLGDTAMEGHRQTTVDLSGCSILEEAYFDGTKVTGVSFPNGGVLKVIHLPATIANLTILNQRAINDLTVGGYSNIEALRIENSNVDSKAMLRAIPSGSRVRLIGIYWTAQDATEISTLLDLLDGMSGMDEAGRNVEKAQVSGEIHTTALTGAQIATFNERYPYLNVTADYVESVRYFKTWDGATTVGTATCYNGVPQSAAPSAPTGSNARADTAQYDFTYVGWATTQDAQSADYNHDAVTTSDVTYYAAYSRTLQEYSVTFVRASTDGGGTLQTKTYQYGQTPSYTGSTPTTSKGSATDYPFEGWTPAIHTVTGTQTYTAKFGAPSFLPDAPTATTADGAYGVEWDYSQSATTLTRKGLAASFGNPSPATSVTGSGSSPFDNIAPWKDMVRYNVADGAIVPYTDPDADTVVYIPEFYYTAYKDTANNKWLWAISPTKLAGYEKHPGSGKYIGRYHTSGDSSAVFTKSGANPLVNVSQTNFRTYSSNKGNGWRMLDLATWSALQMLYLVEFADFHSQNVLGAGWNKGSIGTMGGTDSAAYHTIKASSAHNQYRWVEDPFSNVFDWLDGFVASSKKCYVGASDTGYRGGTSDLTDTGITLPSSGYVTGFGYSEAAFAFIPDTASGGSTSTYVPDYVYSSSGSQVLQVGGNYYLDGYYGVFFFGAYCGASDARGNAGSRLLFDPSVGGTGV